MATDLQDLTEEWMLTSSGIAMYPWAPTEKMVCIDDIAHGLSNICRFSGHSRSFYSVAQHSVLVSSIVDPRFALEGLLHDATEAYCSDLVRSIKIGIDAYKALEKRLYQVIARKFNLPPEISKEVKDADNIALVTEKRDLMTTLGAGSIEWVVEKWGYKPLPYPITPLTPEAAESLFFETFLKLRIANDHPTKV